MPYLVARLPGLVCAMGKFTEKTTVYPLYSSYVLLAVCAFFVAVSLIIIRNLWNAWRHGWLFVLMGEIRAMRSKDAQKGVQILKDTYDAWQREHADNEKLRKSMCGTHVSIGRMLRNLDNEDKSRKTSDTFTRIFMEGNCLRFEAAVKCDPQNATAWFFWGDALANFAAKEEDADRKRHLLEEACEKYAQAAQLESEAPWGWSWWAATLCSLADLEQDADRKRVFLEDACRKLETAILRDPDDAWAWGRRGHVLLALARLEQDGDRRRAMLEDACGKLKESVKHHPDSVPSWLCWAIATTRLCGMEKDTDRKVELLQDARQRFSETVKIDPKSHANWCNWGIELGRLAHMEEDPTTKRTLLEEACEKFPKSAECNPDCGVTWHIWGDSLDQIADIEEAENHPEEARQIRGAAAVKYERAEGIKPGITLYNRACNHALRGDKDTCRELLVRAGQAGALPNAEHLRNDPDLDSVRGEAWFEELLAQREQAEGVEGED